MSHDPNQPQQPTSPSIVPDQIAKEGRKVEAIVEVIGGIICLSMIFSNTQ